MRRQATTNWYKPRFDEVAASIQRDTPHAGITLKLRSTAAPGCGVQTLRSSHFSCADWRGLNRLNTYIVSPVR